MNRRSFLARGAGSIAGATLVAGCIDGNTGSSAEDGGSSDGSNDEDGGSSDGSNGENGGDRTLPGTTPDRETSRTGLAPNPEDVDPTPIDVDALDTTETFGIEVPLLPIDVAYDWYRPQEARFVDARGQSQYESSHVSGAVLSPAPSGYETDDPTEAWPKTERIVTYCTCPHHLSSERAATLIDAGYEAVFALDEGFGEWYERNYPMGSANASATIGPLRSVSGSVDPEYAGEHVQLHHAASEQREPAVIGEDGSFEVTFRFVEVEPDDTLILETPAWSRRGTVEELVEETTR